MTPQYLIRFDDICPTMNWRVWRQVEELLAAFDIKPILAVIPDNQDAQLKVDEPNGRFWDEVRRWQASGWTIGLHGYQHLYTNRDPGILRMQPDSEFSGLTRAEQHSKLQTGLEIFQRERIVAELWIAPSHSFDYGTLEALSELGIKSLSDGFSLFPFLDERNLMWVPQQLWQFRKMPLGLWTVCFHCNRWTQDDIERFRADLNRFKSTITDYKSALAKYGNRRRNVADFLFGHGYGALLK